MTTKLLFAEALAGGPAAVFVFDKSTGRITRYNQPAGSTS